MSVKLNPLSHQTRSVRREQFVYDLTLSSPSQFETYNIIVSQSLDHISQSYSLHSTPMCTEIFIV